MFLFIVLLAPGQISDEEFDELLPRNAIAFAIYMPLALGLGRWWAGRKPYAPIRAWLESGRQANDIDRGRVLRYPAVWALRSSLFWVLGGLLFAALNANLGAANMFSLAATAALGGVTACALQYLLVERVMRPVTGLALAGGQPQRLEAPGVAARLTMTWALATGIALLGIAIFATTDLVGGEFDRERLSGAVLFLALTGIAAGAAAMLLAARSLAESLAGLRGGQERIERREFEARIEVDDGSEVGLVQAGFNRMAAGLAEREWIREAFGAYVDPEVADHILTQGTDLAGESVDATVLFVDIRDFTSWAERAAASEVVATLNRLFAAIVPIIHEHGGHVDKFVGDGLMAVFGAPRRQRDHADRALAAARGIAAAVAEDFEPELRVGIGLNSGTVVAGNVGGAGRLDFSVIGDAVNVAARVEAATRQTGDTILLTAETRDRLTGSAALRERNPIPLKGKSERVALFAPSPGE
ncbi:MAG: adenylate/guanylate cyclase domain-containing protein, partial [Solirubrobacterales bacterium]